jgi:hypothetical protein
MGPSRLGIPYGPDCAVVLVSPGLCARTRLGEAATAPMPIAGEETFGESRRREGTSSSGQACPDGRKEKTNREKTKVATMGVE